MRIEEVWPEWHESTLLGEGSFGKVYKAEREEFGETFYSAIKVLSVPKSEQDIQQERKQGMSDYEIHEYFKSVVQDLVNEIVLMENLKGARNIVNIDDYRIIERTNGIGWDIFIRMELLTPFEDIVNNPAFSYMDVLKMGVDICSALEVCEYNNIVHRDIKPDNIFVSKYGEYKLGDFGISRQLDKTQAHMSRKGTLNFMAPEVYRGDAYGSSVDTYSLGLVLYKLLNNNRLPFISSDSQNLSFSDRQAAFEKRISGQELPDIPQISPSLNYILKKACAFVPENRYYSATEFKNDLIAEMQGVYSYGYGEATIAQNPTDIGAGRSLDSTTNDMLSQGTVVVNGTEDPSSDGRNQQDFYYPENSSSGKSGFSPVAGVGYIAKTSVFCRFAAIPAALAMFILIVIIGQGYQVTVSALAFLIMIVSRNKYALGIGAAAFAVMETISTLSGVEDFELSVSIVPVILKLVGAFLIVLGGITMMRQKEVRFSGMLCLYGFVAFVISAFIGSDSNFLLAGSYFADGIAVFLWSYGYDSTFKPETVFQKVLYYASFALAAAGVFGLIGV